MTPTAASHSLPVHPAQRSMRAWWLPVALSALVFLLAGCAAGPTSLAAGTPRTAVMAQLGAPFLATPMPNGGERLVYTTQPMGFYVYHVELDASGRVERTEQVLTFNRLAGIPLGQWTAADVRATFGPPMRIERVYSFTGDVWTYRFIADINLRRLAHVHIDPTGVVRRVMFTDDPLSDDDRSF